MTFRGQTIKEKRAGGYSHVEISSTGELSLEIYVSTNDSECDYAYQKAVPEQIVSALGIKHPRCHSLVAMLLHVSLQTLPMTLISEGIISGEVDSVTGIPEVPEYDENLHPQESALPTPATQEESELIQKTSSIFEEPNSMTIGRTETPANSRARSTSSTRGPHAIQELQLPLPTPTGATDTHIHTPGSKCTLGQRRSRRSFSSFGKNSERDWDTLREKLVEMDHASAGITVLAAGPTEHEKSRTEKTARNSRTGRDLELYDMSAIRDALATNSVTAIKPLHSDLASTNNILHDRSPRNRLTSSLGPNEYSKIGFLGEQFVSLQPLLTGR